MPGTDPAAQASSSRPAAAEVRVFQCDRCGARMIEHSCKVTCPNCGSRFDCSDLTIYYDELKPARE